MAKNKERASNTLATLSSIMTLLERYPTLTTTDSLLTNYSVNASVGLLMSILEMFGISQNDLINWLAKLLNGNTNGSDGFLNVVEYAVKGILIANLKDLFTCAVDPIIPDSLMKYTTITDKPDPCNIIKESGSENYKEIVIDLNKVDIFGLLNNSPLSKDGGVFYFDAYDSIYGDNETSPYLTPKNTWKSCDFNAYLWYIIHKGNLSTKEDRIRSAWDNRVSLIEENTNNKNFREQFFTPSATTVQNNGHFYLYNENNRKWEEKKQFILCEFNEHVTPRTAETTLPSSNSLRVWINADRYYHTRRIPVGYDLESGKKKYLYMNKTILEFNYEYIMSLKIFETKTLIAAIVNSLFGLSASLSASMSLQEQMVAAKIGEIVRKVIVADDTSSTDCYYSFSNDDYDSMLNDSLNKYNGQFPNGEGGSVTIDTSEIINSLTQIKQTGKLQPQVTTISKTIEQILSATTSQQLNTMYNVQFTFGYSFVTDFLQQVVTQIVLQILGPKVGIVYAINSAILGEVDSLADWEKFIQKFQNVIINIIKTIKDLLVEQLYKYVVEQLKPIIELLISKLILETVKYYKDLIEQLVNTCIPQFNFFSTKNSVIDNVDYADIIPSDTPKIITC